MSDGDLPSLVAAATEAAPLVASSSERATWLRLIADALDAHAGELVSLADAETSLGAGRLTGEVARTTGQLRMFADVIDEGSFLEVVIDHARDDTTPRRPDLRRMLVPLGPVAVYAASNFPFAFSVAGGDTASALAAGCPVVVKAHSGHPRLSVRTAELVSEALSAAGAPAGTFALVHGRDVGVALVGAPGVRAAAFTGSLSGGRALHDLAAGRPDPIPFYGELGSINPVVLTLAAATARAEELAEGLVGSFTLGVGQFCTKPGVVFVPEGTDFEAAVATRLTDAVPAAMLTDRIAEAFPAGLAHLAADHGVEVVAGSIQPEIGFASPVVLATDVGSLTERPEVLLEEVFGPMTMLVRYRDREQLIEALSRVPGSLTATIHAQPEDDLADLVAVLSPRVGRLLFEGWPTGVAVTWSQHHGGPWPATTSIHTSVGATAVRRFQRPLVMQDAPAHLLPAPLRDENPLGIPRRVDGVLRARREWARDGDS